MQGSQCTEDLGLFSQLYIRVYHHIPTKRWMLTFCIYSINENPVWHWWIYQIDLNLKLAIQKWFLCVNNPKPHQTEPRTFKCKFELSSFFSFWNLKFYKNSNWQTLFSLKDYRGQDSSQYGNLSSWHYFKIKLYFNISLSSKMKCKMQQW